VIISTRSVELVIDTDREVVTALLSLALESRFPEMETGVGGDFGAPDGRAMSAMKVRARTTLGDLHRATPWLWLHCEKCQHHAPLACAVAVIRWGANASSDKLWQCARCTACGTKGATIQHPGWAGALPDVTPPYFSAQVNVFVKRPHVRSRTHWAHHDAFATAGYSPIPGKRGVGSKLLDM
jgi:hypothetical protein